MVKSKIQQFWEARSSRYGQNPRGVLPKALPLPILNYLDDWMYSQVRKVIPEDKKVRILDLGCGYGRLAKRIADDYPKAYIVGVDIAQKYVNLFNNNLGRRGRAIKSDIRKLPFPDQSFNVVIAVTTLMYLVTDKDQISAFSEIFRLLKKSGKFVFIERNPTGQSLVTMGGLVTLLRGRDNEEIQAVSYTSGQIFDLVIRFGGCVERHSGLPFWTIFLPFEYIACFVGGIGKLLNLIRRLDNRFGNLLTPSLYISYIGSGVKSNN